MQDSLITISSSCIVAVMREAIVLLAIVFFGALPVPGTTISTPAIQDVRFAPPAVLTDLVIPPKVLSHPPAVYSDEARRRGIEGSVIVQALFDEYGSPAVLKVVKGLGYGLDEAALQALKGWRFSPALRNGLPVTAIAEIEVPFKLNALERIEELKRRLAEIRQLRQSLLKEQETNRRQDILKQRSDEIGRVGDQLLQMLQQTAPH